jgi:hypothetical protein
MKSIDVSDKSFELIFLNNDAIRNQFSADMNLSYMGIHYHRLISIERLIRQSMLENIFK